MLYWPWQLFWSYEEHDFFNPTCIPAILFIWGPCSGSGGARDWTTNTFFLMLSITFPICVSQWPIISVREQVTMQVKKRWNIQQMMKLLHVWSNSFAEMLLGLWWILQPCWNKLLTQMQTHEYKVLQLQYAHARILNVNYIIMYVSLIM